MEAATMQPRATNPFMAVPGAFDAVMTLAKAARRTGLAPATAKMTHLRASQINGCGYCVEMHSREMREAGEPPERIAAVAAWRDAPYFDPAERAALGLTEAVTRMADRPDSVPDALWEDITEHYDEQAVAGLLLEIGVINLWNHVNVPTRQVAGSGPS